MSRFSFLSIVATSLAYAILLIVASQVTEAANASASTFLHLPGCWKNESQETCRRRQCRRERRQGNIVGANNCSIPNLWCVYNVINCYEWNNATQSCTSNKLVSKCTCDSTTNTWSCRQGDCPRRPQDPRC